MEQSPSREANRFPASQEISRISRNPNVHYSIHKCPPTVPILSQLDPVHTPTFHSSWYYAPITPGSPKWSVSLRLLHQHLYTPLLSPIRATCPSHLNLLDFITRTILVGPCPWRVLGLRMETRSPIWRVAANILNKQSQTSDKGWSSSLGVGRGVDNSSP